MTRNEHVMQLVTKINHAFLAREYSDLESIMAEVFGRQDKLAVLVNLANELGMAAFETFCLCGLTHLVQLRDADYAQLLELARGRAIATYHLVTFLFVHAHIRADTLRRLCSDLSEIEKQEQLRLRLANDRPATVNRMTQSIYDDLRVPPDLLASFAAKFVG